eukprot:SM000321S12203  [mRNA]  locus=s321:100156:103501:- [translate_table: standard]
MPATLRRACCSLFRIYAHQDDAVIALEAKRRIYDVVNVLEAVRVVERLGKNEYVWRGAALLPAALAALKADLQTAVAGPARPPPSSTSSDECDGSPRGSRGSSLCADAASSLHDGGAAVRRRHDKSLRALCERFVQLFFLEEGFLVSWDHAVEHVLQMVTKPDKLQTKARRLYDIANILSALHLVEKLSMASASDCAAPRSIYRWLGVRGVQAHLVAITSSLDTSSARRMLQGGGTGAPSGEQPRPVPGEAVPVKRVRTSAFRGVQARDLPSVRPCWSSGGDGALGQADGESQPGGLPCAARMRASMAGSDENLDPNAARKRTRSFAASRSGKPRRAPPALVRRPLTAGKQQISNGQIEVTMEVGGRRPVGGPLVELHVNRPSDVAAAGSGGQRLILRALSLEADSSLSAENVGAGISRPPSSVSVSEETQSKAPPDHGDHDKGQHSEPAQGLGSVPQCAGLRRPAPRSLATAVPATTTEQHPGWCRPALPCKPSPPCLPLQLPPSVGPRLDPWSAGSTASNPLHYLPGIFSPQQLAQMQFENPAFLAYYMEYSQVLQWLFGSSASGATRLPTPPLPPPLPSATSAAFEASFDVHESGPCQQASALLPQGVPLARDP